MLQLAALAVRQPGLDGLILETDSLRSPSLQPAPHPEMGACPSCSDEYGLIDPMYGVVMGWTARAACTLAVSVFLDHLDLLDAAWEYDSFVHNYRVDKLEDRFKVRPVEKHSQLTQPEVRSFKIVRNPYARAVSIYSHQMFSNFSVGRIPDHETLFGAEMRSLLRLSSNADLGVVSLISWLRAVHTVRDRHTTLGSFDQHTRLQTTVGEFLGLIKYGTICKLEEDLAGCLHNVSLVTGAKFSLEKAAEDPADHNSDHEHDSHGGDVAGRPWSSFALSPGEKGQQGYRILPTVDDFYLGGNSGREAAELVADIYGTDFKTYGYDPKATGYGDYDAGSVLLRFEKTN